MKGFIYILKDKIGKFYIGSTENLERRIKKHCSGHTQTTRNMVDPQLVFSEECTSISEARAIERRLKKLKRKDYIEKIVSDGYIKIR